MSSITNTDRAYESCRRAWLAWCADAVVRWKAATPRHVVKYLHAEAGRKMAPRTLCARLAGIARLYDEAGLPSPTNDKAVRQALAAIRAKPRPAPRRRFAIRPRDVVRMVEVCDEATPIGLRNRALLLAMYEHALKPKELVALTVSDIPTFKPSTQMVLIAWAKAVRLTSGPLFRRVFNNNTTSGNPMHPVSVNYIVKTVADAAGLSTTFITAESIRAGRMAGAFAKNEQFRNIMSLGRLKHAKDALNYDRRS